MFECAHIRPCPELVRTTGIIRCGGSEEKRSGSQRLTRRCRQLPKFYMYEETVQDAHQWASFRECCSGPSTLGIMKRRRELGRRLPKSKSGKRLPIRNGLPSELTTRWDTPATTTTTNNLKITTSAPPPPQLP